METILELIENSLTENPVFLPAIFMGIVLIGGMFLGKYANTRTRKLFGEREQFLPVDYQVSTQIPEALKMIFAEQGVFPKKILTCLYYAKDNYICFTEEGVYSYRAGHQYVPYASVAYGSIEMGNRYPSLWLASYEGIKRNGQVVKKKSEIIADEGSVILASHLKEEYQKYFKDALEKHGKEVKYYDKLVKEHARLKASPWDNSWALPW